jgi:hypothetical protein
MTWIVGLVALLYGSFLAAADTSYADNCSSPGDCFGTAGSFNVAVLGIFSLIALSLLLDFAPQVRAKSPSNDRPGRGANTERLSWFERVLGVVPVIGADGSTLAGDRALDAGADSRNTANAAADPNKTADPNSTAAVTTAEGGKADHASVDAEKGDEDANDFGKAARAAADVAKAAEAQAAEASAALEAERFTALTKDPGQGGVITPRTTQEARVALDLEKAGQLSSPVIREPTGAADFLDGKGNAWNYMTSNPDFSPKAGGYSLDDSLTKIAQDLGNRRGIIFDRSNMSPAAAAEFKAAVDSVRSWAGRILWWP